MRSTPTGSGSLSPDFGSWRLTAPEPHYAAVLESATPVAPHTLDGLTGYCVVVGNDDPIPPAQPLAHAIGEHRTRHNGRLVRFPGQERLRGTVALTEVTSGTAIETIDCLGDTPGPDAVLRTQEFVRPILRWTAPCNS